MKRDATICSDWRGTLRIGHLISMSARIVVNTTKKVIVAFIVGVTLRHYEFIYSTGISWKK